MLSFKGLQDKIGFFPHPGQQLVLNRYKANAKKIVIASGVRWGKSAICGFIALYAFLNGVKEISEGKRESVKIWIVAPSYELTKKVFEYIVKWFLKIHPTSSGSVTYRPYPQIKLAEGVWIQGKSATEPLSLLGEELDLIIQDEAAVQTPDIYENYLSARLISRDGAWIGISSPFGQNWFWNEYLKAKEQGNAFNFKTIDNPVNKPELVEKLKAELPKSLYLQNYEASFLPDAASVFPTTEQIICSGILSDFQQGHRYVMGVDLGRYEDYTVICVIDTINNRVVHIERIKETLFPIQKTRIKAVAERYGNARIVVDTTGMGIPVVEDLRNDGLFVIDDYKFTGKSKFDLIQKGMVYIEQKLIWIPPDSESGVPLSSELKAYGFDKTEAGNIRYGAPQGLHDDCVISFLLAVWGLHGKATLETPLQKVLKENQKTKIIESYI